MCLGSAPLPLASGGSKMIVSVDDPIRQPGKFGEITQALAW